MPFERREILFYLAELAQPILTSGQVINGKLPTTDAQIIDALHTRDFPSVFHEVQNRFRTVYMQSGGQEGIMFRVSAGGFFNREEIAGVLVREQVMEHILLKACKDMRIALPRAASKTVIAKDLAIGFQLNFDSVNLMLEGA